MQNFSIMSSENTGLEIDEKNPSNVSSRINKDKKITIKKTTYNNMLKGIILAIAVASFFGGYVAGGMGNSDSNVTTEDIEALIVAMDKKIVQVPQAVQRPTQPSVPSIISVSFDDDPVKGNPNAAVTIVEFSDFQCPFCKRFADQTLPSLQRDYIDTGKVNFVYRDFPLDNIHPNARTAHIAAECADEQEGFWQYHDILFEKQGQWARQSAAEANDSFKQFASDVGLDLTSFSSCLDSQSFADEVNKDYLEGVNYGITGTPTFFIGNAKDGFVKLSGAQPYDVFKQRIEQQLSSK